LFEICDNINIKELENGYEGVEDFIAALASSPPQAAFHRRGAFFMRGEVEK
jgi:hypothetical protein